MVTLKNIKVATGHGTGEPLVAAADYIWWFNFSRWYWIKDWKLIIGSYILVTMFYLFA